MQLIIKKETKYITSLELLEEINFFRKQEGNRTKLKHYDLLKIIRDEFEEEIGAGKISESSYKNSQNKEHPMFELTISQSKQVLVRESKFVRKAVIKKLEKIENIAVGTNNSNGLLLQATKNLLELSSQHEERINDLENKVENSIIIETYQKGVVQKTIGKRVHMRFKELGERVEKKDLYHNIHRELKYKFNVRSYGDLKKKDYEIALEWIENWVENSDLRG